MTRVPTYTLYGELQRAHVPDSLHVESIAERSRLHGWEIKPHRHDALVQLLCLRSGTGEAVFEAQRHPFVAPCVIYVPAFTVHGFRFSSDIDGVVVTVAEGQLDRLPADAPELAARLQAPHCLCWPHRSAVGFAQVDQAVAVLTAEAHGFAVGRRTAIASAWALALVHLARAVADAQRRAQGPAARSLQHAQRFRALLEQSFRTERSLAFYAGQLGITPTQLNRVCRQVFGTSALGALHRRLVLEAQRDLAYSLLSVKEIALSLGFSEAAYFTRFFARQTGSAPSDFRAAARRELARRPAGLSSPAPR